ncbi:hypothetical protein Dsin_029467 [Dipteronia sinensis]|uniref:F-box associated beta-propeller type 1 domain-containing protein n=1 Tax=Dipteronia sinensis TaxID=43782 RepID=A0AAD9ZU46_9ROSI|nr:hypothetical protein Dsin_029467 [Dipteronia sinensis]
MAFVDDNERPIRAGYSVEIYSQNSNSWKQLKEILPRQHRFGASRFGVLVNETLYWRIIYFNDLQELFTSVLCFDTINERFDVIQSPDNVHDYDLGVFKGHLCLVEHHKTGHIDKFMNLPPCEAVSPYDRLALICSMKEDEILASVRPKCVPPWSRRKEEFLLYSPDVKTYKKIHIRGNVKHFIDEITYTDSLVSTYISI